MEMSVSVVPVSTMPAVSPSTVAPPYVIVWSMPQYADAGDVFVSELDARCSARRKQRHRKVTYV